MAHVGYPLLGEGKYGTNKDDRKKGYKHQALYSYKLKFLSDGEKNALSYLDGREFTVKKENIYFLESFK
jgi:23S rRNA pseudouridine955/2504/2580 synthase